MIKSLILKHVYHLRARIRFIRYHLQYRTSGDSLLKHTPHPVTLGPEQISRYFTFIANSERS